MAFRFWKSAVAIGGALVFGSIADNSCLMRVKMAVWNLLGYTAGAKSAGVSV